MSDVTGAAAKQLLTGEHRAGGSILPFWRAVYEVARKDVLIFTRTKRIYIFGGVFTLGLIMVTIFFISLFNNLVGPQDAEIFEGAFGIARANAVMALTLAVPVVGAGFWLFALGIVFSFDAVVREYEDKSLFLILSKPVAREAFVLGKFLGAIFSVSVVFLAVATVCYFVAQLALGDFAAPDDYLRYYGGLALVILGMVALSSLALFGSAITRTTVTSIVFSLSIWIIGLNVLSNIGGIYAATTGNISEDHWLVRALQYTNPTNSLGPAVYTMLDLGRLRDEVGVIGFVQILGGIGLDPLVSVLSLLAFTAVFLGGAILVVNKRNFE